MEFPISIRCPHCDAQLKIKEAALLGRTAKCPGCGTRFTVEAPAVAEDDEYELEQPLPPPPPPAPRAKLNPAQDESKSHGKNSKKSSIRLAEKVSTQRPSRLIAGGGTVAVLILLAGAGIVIWKMPGRQGTLADESQSTKCEQPALTEQQVARLKERDSLKDEAEKLLKKGKLEQAVACRQRVLELERKILGEDAPDVATSLEFIAVCYGGAGNFKQAHATAQQELDLQIKLYGRSDWRVITTRYELSHFKLLQRLPPAQLRATADALRLNATSRQLQIEGRYAEALQAASKAAEINKRVLGEHHRNYAANLHSLAQIYQAQGDYARVEPLYCQVAEIRKENFGEQHPTYAKTLNNLAGLYQTQADYARAEPLIRQAAEIQKKTLGELHADYAQSLNNLALLYNSQGDYARAEPVFRQASEITKKALGEQHTSYALSLNNLALLYYSEGDYARAEPLFRQAAEIQKKALGEQHANSALELDAQPRGKRRLLDGDDHPNYALSINNLALLYHSQGDYARAEPLLRQAAEIQKKALGEFHPEYAGSLNNLAGVYKSQGDFARAEPLFRQASEITKKALGELHPNFARSLNNLAGVYDSQGDFARAEPLYRQALEIQKKVLGEQHPDYAQSLSKLGLLLPRLGSTQEGQRMSTEALQTSRKVLDRTAVIQSERQQLAMARQISSIRNGYISVARLGEASPGSVYTELLPLKGLVSARQQELRLVQQQAARQPDSLAAQAFAQLVAQTRLLAGLSQLTPDPEQAAAHQQRMREVHEKLEEIQQQLTKVSEPYRQAKTQRARTPEELAAALPKHAALVDLIVYGQTCCLMPSTIRRAGKSKLRRSSSAPTGRSRGRSSAQPNRSEKPWSTGGKRTELGRVLPRPGSDCGSTCGNHSNRF